jgi:predicted nucleotidyltransferase
MAKIPEEIREFIAEYLWDLRQEIPVERAVLFGSYAKGNCRKDSDVDLAIFSDFFKSMNRVNGISFLLQRVKNYQYDLEPIPFTMNDYNERDGFAAEVLKEGIEIKGI